MIPERNTSDDEQESPIESEQRGETISEVPFNPKDISINIVPRNIGQIVEMLEDNEIVIPKYQRLPDLWHDKKKSRFIESLMLNLPIPAFYFDEGDDKLWRVIDGLQRISTLKHFILAANEHSKEISGYSEPLKLVDLEFRAEYNGKTWTELPTDVQRRISRNQITINLIGKNTPDIVKYNIFSRINQGSLILEPQEIRTALFQGPIVKFIEHLVDKNSKAGKSFLEATSYSIPAKRQQDLDFITRFVSFYLIDYNNYEPDMDAFLNLGTGLIPTSRSSQHVISKDFEKSMQLSSDIFGQYAFRKILSLPDRRRPINKSLFEVISVNFAKLTQHEVNSIKNNKINFLEEFIVLINSSKFYQAITTGTATKERVKQRHDDFISLIKRFTA